MQSAASPKPLCHTCQQRVASFQDEYGQPLCHACAKFPIRRTGHVLRRNDPCHCGSGRKFKDCCRG